MTFQFLIQMYFKSEINAWVIHDILGLVKFLGIRRNHCQRIQPSQNSHPWSNSGGQTVRIEGKANWWQGCQLQSVAVDLLRHPGGHHHPGHRHCPHPPQCGWPLLRCPHPGPWGKQPLCELLCPLWLLEDDWKTTSSSGGGLQLWYIPWGIKHADKLTYWPLVWCQPGWYRFEGEAGTVLADQAAPPIWEGCGTSRVVWLEGGHPGVESGTVRQLQQDNLGHSLHGAYMLGLLALKNSNEQLNAVSKTLCIFWRTTYM